MFCIKFRLFQYEKKIELKIEICKSYVINRTLNVKEDYCYRALEYQNNFLLEST